jgi:hypothetical protein
MTSKEREAIESATASSAISDQPFDPTRRNLALTLLGTFAMGGLLKGCTASERGAVQDLADYDDREPVIAQLQQALDGTTNVRWFDNIASMRSFSIGANTIYTAIVHGYADPGDGGGGVFVWSTTAAIDDGKATTALYSGTIVNPLVGGVINTSAAAGWRRLYSGPIDVRWFGAKGNRVGNGSSTTPGDPNYRGDDDTAPLAHVFSTSHSTFDLAGRSYRIAVAYGSYLAKWTARSGITIYGNGATLHDVTSHSGSGIGSFTPILWFSACTKVRVLDFNYVGTPLDDLTTKLGRNGAIAVRCTAGTSDVVFTGSVKYAAYGFQTGEYATPSEGGCRSIRAVLNTYQCGYPWASYLCDDIDVAVTADTTCRAVYVAGANGGRIVARFKDQYFAPVQVLVTDALAAGTTESVGCSNLYVEAVDLGSTVTSGNSWCCGIAVQRLHVTKFSNLHFKFGVRGDDAVATNLGGWGIFNNGASFWHPSTVLRHITVEGMIDRSEQTVAGNASGEICAYPYNVDGTYPVVDNLTLSGVVVRKGAASLASLMFNLPGLTAGGLHLERCDFRDCSAIFRTASSSVVRLSGCALSSVLDGGTGPFEFVNCSMTGSLPTAIAFQSKTDGISSLSTTRSLITASTTQAQGQGPLSARYNDITMCANANDTVTLPAADPALGQIWVINYGAQTLRVYPASGDSLGAGTDVPITLASTAAGSWVAVNTLQWRRLI